MRRKIITTLPPISGNYAIHTNENTYDRGPAVELNKAEDHSHTMVKIMQKLCEKKYIKEGAILKVRE